MRKILVTATTLALIMTGCAPKKVSTIGTGSNIPGGTGTTQTQGTTTMGTTMGGYENVDPYGNGSGQYGNGQYGNGEYGNGQYGNGQYSVNEEYGVSSGIQNIYFNADQYSIRPDQLGIVSQNAKLLRGKVSSGNRIKIEGHCDASGTDEYNYALGLRRAKAAKDALQNSGIKPSQMALVSMGESSPECVSSSSSECYAKNRRVEFKVIQ